MSAPHQTSCDLSGLQRAATARRARREAAARARLHRALADNLGAVLARREAAARARAERAAAPDLLAALERLSLCVAGMDQFSLDEDFEAARDQARAAIAKAKGTV